MKLMAAIILSLLLMASSLAQADQIGGSSDSMAMPAREGRAQDLAKGHMWKSADLELRDRSIVALATLIARNQTAEMECHFNLALDRGVKPSEISEIIIQLAFYSGWSNAMSAAAIVRDIFAERGINADQPAQTLGELLLIIDEVAIDEAEALVRNLWQLPGLAPRDRSLVTVSALAASGKVARADQYLGLINKVKAGDATH